MRKLLIIFMALFIMIFGIYDKATAASSSTAIRISDKNLEKEILRVLGKNKGPITSADMSKLTGLSLRQPVKNLNGLEYAKNLTDLDFYQLDFTKINMTPVSKLNKLQTLGLIECKLSNISFVTNLKHLTQLDLSFTNIKDLSPVSGLTNLRNLMINGNHLTDISPIKNLTRLEILHINDNQLTEISALSKMKRLDQLFMSNNQITDLSPLKNSYITTLYAENNQVSDVGFLKYLPKISMINFKRNKLKDISSLKGNKSIQFLHLEENQIMDISSLRTLTKLVGVKVWANPLNKDSANILKELTKKGVFVN